MKYENYSLTVGDIIAKRDYDYISWRIILPDKCCNPNAKSVFENSTFAGFAKSMSGKLVSLDGDTLYDEEDIVLAYEEWSKPEKGIQNGLTVVVQTEWI